MCIVWNGSVFSFRLSWHFLFCRPCIVVLNNTLCPPLFLRLSCVSLCPGLSFYTNNNTKSIFLGLFRLSSRPTECCNYGFITKSGDFSGLYCCSAPTFWVLCSIFFFFCFLRDLFLCYTYCSNDVFQFIYIGYVITQASIPYVL